MRTLFKFYARKQSVVICKCKYVANAMANKPQSLTQTFLWTGGSDVITDLEAKSSQWYVWLHCQHLHTKNHKYWFFHPTVLIVIQWLLLQQFRPCIWVWVCEKVSKGPWNFVNWDFNRIWDGLMCISVDFKPHIIYHGNSEHQGSFLMLVILKKQKSGRM